MTPSNSSMSRRDALKLFGAGVAAAGLGFSTLSAATAGVPTKAGAMLGWDLPPLGYGYDALEPHIDAKTMEIHYTKHHQAYINNAKQLLQPHPELLARGPEALVKDLASVPESIRTGIRNNAGGHVNHAFFWKIISPGGGAVVPEALGDGVNKNFGSLDEMKKQFAEAAAKRFGSGWAWLSRKADGSLIVHSTANQDSPLSEGLQPVLGVDVWEHAYYLRYQNVRADYVTAFWKALNWNQAGANFASTAKK